MSYRRFHLAPFLSAAALVLVTWTPRPVLAQGQVAIGQTVTSQITASSPVNAEGRRYALWTFGGAAGQSVRIDMASYELDSYLILQNANGAELARNDDGGGRLNAQITQTLPANGTYRILAVSFRTGGAMFGSYTLSVNAAGAAAAPVTPPPAQAPTAAVATPIVIGQTVTSQITASSPVNAEGRRYALWTFGGAAGQSVRIDMASYELDSYLILQNANGAELARNDDGGGRLNAQITQTLPANGTYRILAVSFRTGGAMFGDYTLSVNAAGAAGAPVTPPPAQAPTAAVATPIVIGQTVTSQMTASSPVNAEGRRYALWTFGGTAGQSVRIDMASYELDSYLILQNANGAELARNDDGGGRLNAQITQTLPANGTYRILAVSFRTGGAMFGDYTLSVNAAGMAAPPPPTAATAMSIVVGQTMTSQLTTSSAVNAEGRRYALWTFAGAAGQSIRINMASGEIDSYLVLQDANGTDLARDDDGGGYPNAQIALTLPVSGRYRILAVSYRRMGAMFGTYTLSVNGAGMAVVPVTPPPVQTPAPVVSPTPTPAQPPAAAAAGMPMRIATGEAHSCALVGGGAVMCWGKNNWGQLGDGSTTNRATPAPLNSGPGRPELRFVEITAGGNHTCGLTSDGRAWCWGVNSHGQLGKFWSSNDPALPVAAAGGRVFTKLAAGNAFTCGIADQTGIAYCWGYQYGGDPVAITGTSQLTVLTAGSYHACGATAAGAAWCWGRGESGQLGGGREMDFGVQAVAVAGGLTFRQLTAGGAHTCGVASDGRAYCWGANRGRLGSGQPNYLGSGQFGPPSAVPVPVNGGLTFTQITAGWEHTCGVASGGVAYCWGRGDRDQLGLGAPGFRGEPAAIAGSARFVQVAAGTDHTCGIATDGTVWCWGSNAFGQAGDGSTANTRSSPVQVLLPR